MIIPAMWSLIQDDNNYINKTGKLTSICDMCGNVYTTNLQLSVDCQIDPYEEGYRLKENPEVVKMCDCSCEPCHRIDNLLTNIILALKNKGYHIKYDRCCEGHIYQKDTEVVGMTFPVIEIKENLFLDKNYPDPDNKMIIISNGKCNGTIIRPVHKCPNQYTVEQYERLKTIWLHNLLEFVEGMPVAESLRKPCDYGYVHAPSYCTECGMIIE